MINESKRSINETWPILEAESNAKDQKSNWRTQCLRDSNE